MSNTFSNKCLNCVRYHLAEAAPEGLSLHRLHAEEEAEDIIMAIRNFGHDGARRRDQREICNEVNVKHRKSYSDCSIY